MTVEREALRDWHRRFGLLLIDLFTGSPFTVDVERDLSQQQQFLDVVIVRRGRGRLVGALPDGLEDLVEHNLLTFKSHREALDDWAIRELVAHYVAYRKLVSPSPSDLLAPEQFKLYAVAARFPHNLSGQVPWQEIRPGVYDCRWGLDVVRVIVAGQLAREARNAPLHLFSAAPGLVSFARGAYHPRSPKTSGVLWDLLKNYEGEGLLMGYTMSDFMRDFFKKYLPQLTPEECREVVESLPPEAQEAVLQAIPPEKRLAGLPLEERLAGLPEEQVRRYLEQLTTGRAAHPRKPRRKK